MNQLKAGALLSYVIIGLNILVGLLYTPYMLRLMGQTEYGLYSLAASVISYLTVLDLGFGNAIVRYTAKFRSENKLKEQYEMFGMFFIVYLIIGLLALSIGLFAAFNISSLYDNSMTENELFLIKVMLLILSGNLAFTFPLSIFGSIISAYENFVFQKVINIIRVVLNTFVMIVLLHYGYKAIGLVVVTTVFNLMSLVFNTIFCFYKLKIKLLFSNFDWSFFKEISYYSFWIFLNAIMDRMYWSTGQFVLGIYHSASVIAVFSVALQLKQMFFMFSSSISTVFLPRITGMVAKGVNDKEISNLFIKTGRIQYLIISYLLVVFILFGKQFVSIWAGDGYAQVYYITLILVIPASVPLIQNMGIVILQARNQMRFRSLVYIVIAGISVLISFLLAKEYSGIGCACAISFALILGQGVIMNIYYYKIQHIDIIQFWFEVFKMSFVPFISLVFGIYILKYISIGSIFDLMTSGCVFTFFYISLTWMFSMNSYERNLIAAPFNQIFNKLKLRYD